MPGAQSDGGSGVLTLGNLACQKKALAIILGRLLNGGRCLLCPDVVVGAEAASVRSPWFHPAGLAAQQREAGGEGGVSDTMLSTQEGLGDTESVFIVPRPVEKGEGPALEFKARVWAEPATTGCCDNQRQAQAASGCPRVPLSVKPASGKATW